MDLDRLLEKAYDIRKTIMKVGYETQSGHPSSALSCVEILTALYYGDILKYDIDNVDNPSRDRFILSKGHACIVQYVILADLGIIPKEWLNSFCKPGCVLGGHPNCLVIPGIENSTGSLGHGLSYAIGTALAAKYKGSNFHTYVLVGDGESQEGSVWEGLLNASHHKLNNLTVIFDYNKIQASGYTEEIGNLAPLKDKLESFQFHSIEIDGNDMKAVINALNDKSTDKPNAIIANTLKGKGVSIMENKTDWHSRRPNASEWQLVARELGI